MSEREVTVDEYGITQWWVDEDGVLHWSFTGHEAHLPPPPDAVVIRGDYTTP